MNCPVCTTRALEAFALGPNLTSQKCGLCGGQWISSLEFAKWLERSRGQNPEPLTHQVANEITNEARPIKTCPECGHLLTRYKVGHALNFSLDRCGNCGGTWFDRNEWEILQASELRTKIHLVFSAAWQRQIRQEDRARHLQELLVEKIGEKDFEEISRIKGWLDKHPRKQELLAFLTGDEF